MKTTFLCSGYALFDGLALGDALGDPAEPKPFRLFAVGENRLTRNGKTCTLTLSEEDVAAIAGYHKAKGEKIPFVHVFRGLFRKKAQKKALFSQAASAVGTVFTVFIVFTVRRGLAFRRRGEYIMGVSVFLPEILL